MEWSLARYLPAMRIRSIHHVQLAMPPGGEQLAAAFYAGLLGIPEVDKPEHLRARGGCWFESAEVRVHLGVEDGFRPARKAHPAFEVDGLSTLRERLKASGVEMIDDQPLPGYDRFYVDDPFGNRLELLERQPRGLTASLRRSSPAAG